jgi:prevent-host-death family protein
MPARLSLSFNKGAKEPKNRHSVARCFYKIGVIMRELAITQDISPLSEFIAGVGSFLKKVCNTGPLVITQHGKGVAVLLEVGEYETMQAKIELLAIRKGFRH